MNPYIFTLESNSVNPLEYLKNISALSEIRDEIFAYKVLTRKKAASFGNFFSAGITHRIWNVQSATQTNNSTFLLLNENDIRARNDIENGSCCCGFFFAYHPKWEKTCSYNGMLLSSLSLAMPFEHDWILMNERFFVVVVECDDFPNCFQRDISWSVVIHLWPKYIFAITPPLKIDFFVLFPIFKMKLLKRSMWMWARWQFHLEMLALQNGMQISYLW